MRFIVAFESTITLTLPDRHTRARLICSKALIKASKIRVSEQETLDGKDGEDQVMDGAETGNAAFDKNVKLVENLVKLCMQKLFTSILALQD